MTDSKLRAQHRRAVSRFRMCRMKRRYGTEGEAVNSLERSRRFNPAFWNCDLYACPYCHGYHIGTVTKRPVYRYY